MISITAYSNITVRQDMWNVWGGEEKSKQGFVGKPDGKSPVGRPSRRWVRNIKTGLKDIG
jgi:hypothetical protein